LLTLPPELLNLVKLLKMVGLLVATAETRRQITLLLATIALGVVLTVAAVQDWPLHL
jgi:hypothetical protein